MTDVIRPCVPNPMGTLVPTGTGVVVPSGIGAFGAFRLPTDPLFYFAITLENIVIGSRYRVTRNSDGLELATGTAASTTEVISGVPAYSSNMLMNLTIRNASGSPAYKIFDTSAYAARDGAFVYVLQQSDE